MFKKLFKSLLFKILLALLVLAVLGLTMYKYVYSVKMQKIVIGTGEEELVLDDVKEEEINKTDEVGSTVSDSEIDKQIDDLFEKYRNNTTRVELMTTSNCKYEEIKTEEQFQAKLKETFYKRKDVIDYKNGLIKTKHGVTATSEVDDVNINVKDNVVSKSDENSTKNTDDKPSQEVNVIDKYKPLLDQTGIGNVVVSEAYTKETKKGFSIVNNDNSALGFSTQNGVTVVTTDLGDVDCIVYYCTTDTLTVLASTKEYVTTGKKITARFNIDNTLTSENSIIVLALDKTGVIHNVGNVKIK